MYKAEFLNKASRFQEWPNCRFKVVPFYWTGLIAQGHAKKFLLSLARVVLSGLMGCAPAAKVSG